MLLIGTVFLVWFQKLKASIPICALKFSVKAVVLNNDRSVFQIAGPLKLFRGRLPYRITVPAAFAGSTVRPVVVEKAALFKYLSVGTPENGSLICVGRTTSQLHTTVNGNPERAVWIKLSCQPDTSLSGPLLIYR